MRTLLSNLRVRFVFAARETHMCELRIIDHDTIEASSSGDVLLEID